MRWPRTFTGSVRQLSVSGGPSVAGVRCGPDFYQASACRFGVVDLGLGCPEQAGDVAYGAGCNRAGRWGSWPALWVPIIHPCWSGSMPVLVEGAAEPVPSADIQLRDPLTIGNRLG